MFKVNYFCGNMLNCIILAGGKSSRMGMDKASLPFGEITLLNHIVTQLISIKDIDKVFIISNNEQHQIKGTIRYNDLFKESGPLGAIYTGLVYSNSAFNLVLSCDSPFFDKLLFNKLNIAKINYDAVIPVFKNSNYYLMGIYSKNMLPIIKNQLLLKNYKVSDMLAISKVNYLPLDDLLDSRTFLNINTKEEYQIALKILQNENNR